MFYKGSKVTKPQNSSQEHSHTEDESNDQQTVKAPAGGCMRTSLQRHFQDDTKLHDVEADLVCLTTKIRGCDHY